MADFSKGHEARTIQKQRERAAFAKGAEAMRAKIALAILQRAEPDRGNEQVSLAFKMAADIAHALPLPEYKSDG